jgi:hypothetical protein
MRPQRLAKSHILDDVKEIILRTPYIEMAEFGLLIMTVHWWRRFIDHEFVEFFKASQVGTQIKTEKALIGWMFHGRVWQLGNEIFGFTFPTDNRQ